MITNGKAVLGATDAAASGAPHIEEPVAYDAILLAGFGGPEGQDDVIPYLRNVTRGRGIPEERLEEVAHHYRHFGGVSPINDHNRQLKAALEAELAARGIELPVLWGNRNWAPYVKDVVVEAHERGYTKLIAIATSAYSSFSSCRQYREDFAMALDATATCSAPCRSTRCASSSITPVSSSRSSKASPARTPSSPSRAFSPAETHVLFATHSIPMTDAERSGPSDRDFGEGGAYAAQHRAVAEVVMAAAAPEPTENSWALVYQSRSGPPSMPWLEPDINDAIAALDKSVTKAVIIVPLGFVSDHMEVLWDLDNEAMETAEENGLTAIRVPTPGVHPEYVRRPRRPGHGACQRHARGRAPRPHRPRPLV